MLDKALETNSTQFFNTYTTNQRLIDIEIELNKKLIPKIKRALRIERITLLKALKTEKLGVSMGHSQPFTNDTDCLD